MQRTFASTFARDIGYRRYSAAGCSNRDDDGFFICGTPFVNDYDRWNESYYYTSVLSS